MPLRTVALVACSVAVSIATASAQAASSGQQATPVKATVLFHDRVVTLSQTMASPTDLWVVPSDLTRINDFVLKPEGACLAELCVPVRQDRDSQIFVTRGGQAWFSVTELARRLQQPFVQDADHGVWSFGDIPAARNAFFQTAMAPDFALPDRNGRVVRLSDFRGKRVLVVTWASWCGCRADLANWQTVYESIKGENFEIVAVAEDTGGMKAAGQWYTAARPTYTTLIDTTHLVTELYHLVNVPSAIWVDEQGRVARIDEGTYTGLTKIGSSTTTYLPLVKDWAANGTKSRYAWSAAEMAKRIRTLTSDEALADPTFKLGVYFFPLDQALARTYWQRAQALAPDNWNYHRQDWIGTEGIVGPKFQSKRGSLGGKPYYAPIEIQQREEPAGQSR